MKGGMNQAYWDDIAVRYDEEILDAVKNDKNGVIKQSIRGHADKTHLAADFGCGIGKTLPLLSRCFSIVDAYDLSGKNLELARWKCRRFPNVRYHHRDLSTDDRISGKVDFAISINVLLAPSPETRSGILRTICDGLLPRGILLLVAPSLESALYSDFRLLEWNLREGVDYDDARREGLTADSKNGGAVANGIVTLDGVATKHYLREELHVTLRSMGLETIETHKVEYAWSTEFDEVPAWLKGPYPWDWMVLAQKR
ncbi:MAG: class I SAM-dependent methyltransferase [Candidatus Hydrogenedentes bacterium]|nr:class I SAM-dependent methyltransferase [Candidatus Hydrogenedentota bacterium]